MYIQEVSIIGEMYCYIFLDTHFLDTHLLSFNIIIKSLQCETKPRLMSNPIDTSNRIDNVSTIHVIWDFGMHNNPPIHIGKGEVAHSLQAWKSSNGYPCELLHCKGGQHLLPSSR